MAIINVSISRRCLTHCAFYLHKEKKEKKRRHVCIHCTHTATTHPTSQISFHTSYYVYSMDHCSVPVHVLRFAFTCYYIYPTPHCTYHVVLDLPLALRTARSHVVSITTVSNAARTLLQFAFRLFCSATVLSYRFSYPAMPLGSHIIFYLCIDIDVCPARQPYYSFQPTFTQCCHSAAHHTTVTSTCTLLSRFLDLVLHEKKKERSPISCYSTLWSPSPFIPSPGVLFLCYSLLIPRVGRRLPAAPYLPAKRCLPRHAYYHT